MIAAVILMVFGGLGGLAWVKSNKPHLDAETFCPEGGPVSVTAVLLDTTDPWDPVQQEYVQRRFAEIRQGIPTRGAFELYRVAPTDNAALDPLARLCNPGRGSEISPLIGNPTQAEEKWRTSFDEPLREALQNATRSDSADSSPIIESIRSVSVTAFAGLGRADREHRLILVSDLVQHSNLLSMFKGYDPERFLDSAAFARQRPDLQGTNVEVIYLNRTTNRPIQGSAHIRFWRDLIVASGGRVVLVDRI